MKYIIVLALAMLFVAQSVVGLSLGESSIFFNFSLNNKQEFISMPVNGCDNSNDRCCKSSISGSFCDNSLENLHCSLKTICCQEGYEAVYFIIMDGYYCADID